MYTNESQMINSDLIGSHNTMAIGGDVGSQLFAQ